MQDVKVSRAPVAADFERSQFVAKRKPAPKSAAKVSRVVAMGKPGTAARAARYFECALQLERRLAEFRLAQHLIRDIRHEMQQLHRAEEREREESRMMR